jgi:hypothetical protein
MHDELEYYVGLSLRETEEVGLRSVWDGKMRRWIPLGRHRSQSDALENAKKFVSPNASVVASSAQIGPVISSPPFNSLDYPNHLTPLFPYGQRV